MERNELRNVKITRAGAKKLGYGWDKWKGTSRRIARSSGKKLGYVSSRSKGMGIIRNVKVTQYCL